MREIFQKNTNFSHKNNLATSTLGGVQSRSYPYFLFQEANILRRITILLKGILTYVLSYTPTPTNQSGSGSRTFGPAISVKTCTDFGSGRQTSKEKTLFLHILASILSNLNL
jgi:hypothetical protein